MAIKTNKSYKKRLKVTKTGKILARKSGQNHFNAKERRSVKDNKKQNVEFKMTNKERSRFLVNIK
jgi:ribosomal protein L35